MKATSQLKFMNPNLSPYGIAATAAENAKRFAQVQPCQRVAYARRVAFRALRASCPYVGASEALRLAKTVSTAPTAAYFSA